jgi:hypothetical protein
MNPEKNTQPRRRGGYGAKQEIQALFRPRPPSDRASESALLFFAVTAALEPG